jgi:hypothetical protein
MIKQKLDNKLISSVTGLTLEEILKLKTKISFIKQVIHNFVDNIVENLG